MRGRGEHSAIHGAGLLASASSWSWSKQSKQSCLLYKYVPPLICTSCITNEYHRVFHPSPAQTALQMNIVVCSTPHLHKLHYRSVFHPLAQVLIACSACTTAAIPIEGAARSINHIIKSIILTSKRSSAWLSVLIQFCTSVGWFLL